MERDIQQILEEVLAEGQNVLVEGKVVNYIPELAKADSSNLGYCIMNADGSIYKVGDYNISFTMQNIAKTFSLTFVLQISGYDHTFSKVGMGPAGDRFDSILQLELKDWRSFNPMTNAGAVVTADCIAVADPLGKLLTLVRKLCGNPKTQLNEKVYRSEKRTGIRNRSTAYLLKNDHAPDGEPEDVLGVYSRMRSVMCTARDLAHYAMILSSKDVDPKTGECLLDADIVRIVTTLMMLCGMYDESGEYVTKIGLSPKSGVGGGIVAVGQSSMDIGTFGPMLSKKGSSVGGEKILRYLSEHLGYHILA